MSVECFLDTNLFIYQLEAADERKSAIASDLIRDGIASGNACISFQVVQECLNTIRRKAEVPLDVEGTRRYLDAVLRPLWQVMPTMGLYNRALDLQTRYRHGFYDSMIIAAAIGAGCRRLYTEDLQHGQRIEQLRIENPFID
mgnify:CR=1 FL=1